MDYFQFNVGITDTVFSESLKLAAMRFTVRY